ncbi:MAG TPA: cytochrome c3 family protein [Solirubrobacteraceae bacterium]
MMRGAAVFAAACVVSLYFSCDAAADNGPHIMGMGATTDRCAMCHRAHTAQAPYLLKQPEEALCYTCHGTSGTGSNLDVADGVGYSGAGRTGAKMALRGGGFKYALIDSAHPSGNGYVGEIPTLASGAAVTSAHSVDSSSQMAWGNGPINGSEASYGKQVALRCGSCHDPHGNGNYRILRPIPQESGATTGVSIGDTTAKVYTTENYWEVEDESAPEFVEKISSWCATCHTRYLAGHNSATTSSGDKVFTYRHRTNETSQSTPTCIQCHVAHGSNASMGTYSAAIANPDGSSAVSTPAGPDSRLLRIDNMGVCQMCHNK